MRAVKLSITRYSDYFERTSTHPTKIVGNSGWARQGEAA
jgi:hypothetical protein